MAAWANLAPPEEAALVRLLANIAAVGPLAGRGVAAGTAERLLAGLAPQSELVAADLARAAGWRTPAALFGLESQLEEEIRRMTQTQDLPAWKRAAALIEERGIDLAEVLPIAAVEDLAAAADCTVNSTKVAIASLRRERGIRLSRQELAQACAARRNGHAPREGDEPAEPRPGLKERIEQELERRGLFLGEKIPEADKHEMVEALDTTYASLVTQLSKMRNGRGIRLRPEAAQSETGAEEGSGVTAGEGTRVTKADLQAPSEQPEEALVAAAAIPEPAPLAAPTAIPTATVASALLELKRERLRAVLVDLGLAQVLPEALRPVLREIALGGDGG